MNKREWTLEMVKDEAGRIGIDLTAKDTENLVDILNLMSVAYNIGYENGKAVKEVPLDDIPMMTDEMWNELAKRKSPCDLAGYTRDK